MIKTKNKSVIFYDGECNLCYKSIQFIIKHDPKKQFLFVSFQSDATAKLLLQLCDKNTVLNSIVLIDDNLIYKKSTAVLFILKKIGGIWGLFYFLKIVPKIFRDFIYDIVAMLRYKWFGKCDICHMKDTYKNENRSI